MDHYSEGKGVISMVASLLNGSVALSAPVSYTHLTLPTKA